MSVGVQRLRDEPDVIRTGALDKGEDATLVDTALGLDARRRALLGEADALKAERNTASKQVGEAIKAGAAPAVPRSRPCAPRRSRRESGSRRWTSRSGASRPSSKTRSCGSRTRPTRTCRSATPART